MTDQILSPDILIAGGGIQGVTLLHELSQSGARRVLLASRDALGVGETLHSHGYLHHGYMMPAAAAPLVRELHDCGAWWRKQGLTPEEPSATSHYAVAGGAVEERRAIWDRSDLEYQPVDTTPDALRGGAADKGEVRLFCVADRTLSMRDLMKDLADPLQDRIVRARLETIELDGDGERVARCVLSTEGEDVSVRPKILLLACGRSAQPLLRSARTPSGKQPLETRCADLNAIRLVPMLLVRGRSLPELTCFFESHALCVFTHQLEGDESMWIVTPLDGHQTNRGDFDPEDERVPGGEVIADSIKRLCSLVPAAGERLEDDLSFSFYFGAKIDHPQGGNRRYLDDCGIRNLRLCWPGLWSLALSNAREVVGQLKSSGEFASVFDPALPRFGLDRRGLTPGVPVGEELRLTNSLPWNSWAEFKALHRVS